MEVSRLEDKVEKLPKHSILSLQQILSLEFLREQDKGHKDLRKPYPLLLVNFLTSPVLLGIEEVVGVGDNIEKNYRQPINRNFSNYW